MDAVWKNKNTFSIKWLLLPLFMLKIFAVSAQDKGFQGIVFDKDTKERIARVSITNLNTRKSWYNDLKAEFRIDAKAGDKVVFMKEDYLPDTVLVKNNATMLVYLQRTAIMLRTVTIRDTLNTPMQRLMATRREYNKAYGSNAYNDPFSTIAGGGAGLNLDALYNSLSKSGRNAEHLQELIQRDYEQNVIDYRFNKSVVSNITKLKDRDLADFMIKYRPSYYIVTTDSEYEFISYIRTSLRRYLRNKKVFALPALKPAQS